jgi:hypothetical protein
MIYDPKSPIPEGVMIEVHRTPPVGYEGEQGKNIGHIRAKGNGVSVSLPCSLALLDDSEAVEHYIKTRLLLFHKLEVEKQEQVTS